MAWKARLGTSSYLVAGRAKNAVTDAEHGRGHVLEGDGRNVVEMRRGGLKDVHGAAR
jgi:hypothetical protein